MRLKLWLVRDKGNYFHTGFVVARDEKGAVEEGRKRFRRDCTAAEVRVPGYVVRVEPEEEPVNLRLFGGDLPGREG